MDKNTTDEQGYVLLGVLFILALSLIITEGMLDSSATNSKTRAIVNTQSRQYYEVEQTLNGVVGWLQENSKNMVSAFSDSNFTSNFDLGAPTLGDNEGLHFGVPTMVKMAGTNDSVMLSNNDFFGENAFPAVEHIDTGAAFDAISSFQNANLGPANARVVMIWARETDGNYEPIFRIDVVTGNNPDRGVHSFSYVQSTLVSSAGSAPGFYGRDSATLNTPNNDCFSYLYTFNAPGSWSRGAPRANCPVGSDGMITTSADINGSAKSLVDPGVTLAAPGGSVSGDICEGAGCHAYSLPAFGDWDSYCAGNTTDMNVGSNTTLATGGCYRDFEISNKKTLTLTDTTTPYYFRTLDFRSNFATLAFGDIPEGDTITVYVETVSNNRINGNQMYNPNNAPHQIEFNYIGAAPFLLNGTASFGASIVAPNAPVTVSGNFTFYGGIKTTTLTVSGNARINYDEGLGATAPVLGDMNYSLKKSSQRYR